MSKFNAEIFHVGIILQAKVRSNFVNGYKQLAINVDSKRCQSPVVHPIGAF